MTTTRKIVTLAFAALLAATATFTAAPANAGGFTFAFGGPLNLPPLGDDNDFGMPKLQKRVQDLTQAEIEQAIHQCNTVKRIAELIDEMEKNHDDDEDINRWRERLKLTVEDCMVMFHY